MLEYIKNIYYYYRLKLVIKYMFHTNNIKLDKITHLVINNLEWFYNSPLVTKEQRLKIVDNIMNIQEEIIYKKDNSLNYKKIERIDIGYKHILNYKHINNEIESNYCYEFIIAVFEELLNEFRDNNYLLENNIEKLIIKLRHKFRKKDK